VAEQAPSDEGVSDPAAAPGPFERDTQVQEQQRADRDPDPSRRLFGATVSPDWRAGRGPHGGYIAAIILRALTVTVADPARPPRSLTIHYARAPEPGPVEIATVIERAGRSVSTLSARVHQDGILIALALSAFSVPWSGPELAEIQMPAVTPPDARSEPVRIVAPGAPSFVRHLVLQPRLGGMPLTGTEQPMAFGAWLGLAEPRPVDALSLAFYCDALIPTPFMRMDTPTPAPTIDLTVHFRAPGRANGSGDPHELCLAQARGRIIHEGFFEEDCVIWSADGTVLAQSRQLAILVGGSMG